MVQLVDIRRDEKQITAVFDDQGRTLNVELSGPTAALLVAGLAQAVIDTSEPNRPETAWLQWPPAARSSDVSFDIDAIGDGLVGVAIKLPGLMPVVVEIPP